MISGDPERRLMSQILQSITYADFQAFQAKWLKTGRMLWFAYGNISSQTAVDIVERARASLSLTAVARD